MQTPKSKTLAEQLIDRKFRARLRKMRDDSENWVWVLNHNAATSADKADAIQRLKDRGWQDFQIEAAQRRGTYRQ
jgi:hypothetical protein